MKAVALHEVASINPRGETVASDAEVSFVGMAELNAEAAVASPRETRLFADVSKGYTIFHDRDVLAAKITPCWENGKVGQAQLDHRIGVGSTEFHVLRPGVELDDRYLLHFLRRPAIRHAGQLRMTGSAGQKRVPVSFLQELAIPFPPLVVQRRIAAVLDHANAVCAKRRQVLAHLDTLVQSIFHGMFDALDIDATVGDVAGIQGGLQVSAKRAALPAEAPYLRVANVHRGRLDLSVVKTIRGTAAEIARTRLLDGDLLFVEGHANPQEVGRVALWSGKIDGCVHQNHLIRARLDRSRVLPIFASTWLNSDRGAAHFRRAGRTTSGLNTISASTVRSAPTPLPTISLQRKFAAQVELVDAQRDATLRAIAADGVLFASLQSRAFRGEL